MVRHFSNNMLFAFDEIVAPGSDKALRRELSVFSPTIVNPSGKAIIYIIRRNTL